MRTLPNEPGMYFWDEWNKVVEVKQRGNKLAVKAFDHWQKYIPITPRIAGNFYKVDENGRPIK